MPNQRTKREKRAERRERQLTFAAGAALQRADARRQATAYNEIRSVCADDCGVLYHIVDSLPREGDVFDYDVETQDVKETISKDGTPGSIRPIDETMVRESRDYIADIGQIPIVLPDGPVDRELMEQSYMQLIAPAIDAFFTDAYQSAPTAFELRQWRAEREAACTAQQVRG